MTKPPTLRLLHSEESLVATKLEVLRRLATDELIASLRPNQPGSLKVRPDGTIIYGHHRIIVLRERSVDVDSLPREIISKD